MMPDGFCARLIRSRNRNLLVAALLLAAGPALFFGYFHRYFTGYFQPLQPMTIADVSTLDAEATADRFVRIVADDVAPSGIDENHSPDKVDRGTYRLGTYLVASASGHAMLVYVGQGASRRLLEARAFEGVLVPVDERYQLRTLSDGAVDLDLHQMAPVFLDTDHYRKFGRVSFFFGGAMLLVSIPMLFVWLWRAVAGARHPFMRRLAIHGEPQALATAIDLDMAPAHAVVRYSGERVEVGRQWLVAATRFNAVPLRLQSLVWFYHVRTDRSLHSFFAYDAQGRRLRLKGVPQEKAAAIMQAVAATGSTPNAVQGDDPRLEAIWKDLGDKSGFAAAARPLMMPQPGHPDRLMLPPAATSPGMRRRKPTVRMWVFSLVLVLVAWVIAQFLVVWVIAGIDSL